MKVKHFGVFIRRMRYKKGLSLDKLSSRCRLATGYLRMVEEGQHRPGSDNLERIARGLDAPLLMQLAGKQG